LKAEYWPAFLAPFLVDSSRILFRSLMQIANDRKPWWPWRERPRLGRPPAEAQPEERTNVNAMTVATRAIILIGRGGTQVFDRDPN